NIIIIVSHIIRSVFLFIFSPISDFVALYNLKVLILPLLSKSLFCYSTFFLYLHLFIPYFC
ncbi:MAG TPA: hypothetical protein PLI56_08285, partial [Exilispira sp.]|nr:hypothetical protein [Exilispira sp.]